MAHERDPPDALTRQDPGRELGVAARVRRRLLDPADRDPQLVLDEVTHHVADRPPIRTQDTAREQHGEPRPASQRRAVATAEHGEGARLVLPVLRRVTVHVRRQHDDRLGVDGGGTRRDVLGVLEARKEEVGHEREAQCDRGSAPCPGERHSDLAAALHTAEPCEGEAHEHHQVEAGGGHDERLDQGLQRGRHGGIVPIAREGSRADAPCATERWSGGPCPVVTHQVANRRTADRPRGLGRRFKSTRAGAVQTGGYLQMDSADHARPCDRPSPRPSPSPLPFWPSAPSAPAATPMVMGAPRTVPAVGPVTRSRSLRAPLRSVGAR